MAPRVGSAQHQINQLEMTFGVSGVIAMLARRCADRAEQNLVEQDTPEWRRAEVLLNAFARKIGKVLEETTT